jgi:hypothetical protein
MRFQREILTKDLCAELGPLLEKHYLEIAHYQDIPLDPDFDQYIRMEDIGLVRCFTVRDGNGELKGYAIFFVKKNIHYKSSLQASQDVIFLDQECRKTGQGAKFIDYCDHMLKLENAQAVYHHVKEAHNFGPLLEKLGYKLVDLVYARRLD